MHSSSILAQPVELEALTIEDGLSQGLVTSVIQTKDGFLWMSTQIGLNRYDGYQFTEFSNDPFNPYSLGQNDFAYLFEDSRGWMWILFGNGRDTDVYDPESGRFYHLKMGLPEWFSLESPWCEDPTGAMWLGGNRLEVNQDFLKKANGATIEAPLEILFKSERQGSQNMSLRMLFASDSVLYLLADRGFYSVDWVSKQIDTLHVFEDVLNSNTEDPLARRRGSIILEDSNGQIWVSLDRIYFLSEGHQSGQKKALVPIHFRKEKKGNLFESGGWIYTIIKELNRFSPQDAIAHGGQMTTVVEQEDKSELIFYNPCIDRSGVVWLGTSGYGLRKFSPLGRKFPHYLPGVSMRSIFLDNKGNVWKEFPQHPFEQIELTSGKPIKQIGANRRNLDLMQDKTGRYWIAGESAEKKHQLFLLRVDGQTGAEKWFATDLNIVDDNPNKIQRAILEDQKIWLLGNDSLACFTIDTEQFEYFDLSHPVEKNQLPSPNFTTFIKTGEREFWAGSYEGLYRMDLGNNMDEVNIQHFSFDQANPQSLSLNHIWSLCPDPRQPELYLWVGTAGRGLNRLDKTTGECRHFIKKDGLPNEVIYSILPGTKQDLWMSTNYGLSNFDPATERFANFSSADGLQSNEFNAGSAHRADDGTLFFGGVNGLNMFHPDSLRLNEHVPPIAITGLKVNNEVVDYRISFSGEKIAIISQPINRVKQVQLAYFQNVIGIEYAALDFTDPTQNRYRHQLVGVDDDWVEAGHENSVQYANLPPGKYLFKVIGSNNDDLWNDEPAALEIIILPPWWKTNWAYAVYLLALLGGLFWLYAFQVERVKERNLLAYEIKEAERLAELDRIKTDFFSNVTHEFRTPLTLILEPVRQMLKEDVKGQFRERLLLVKNNGEKMLTLVNQLLDMAKMEGGKMGLDLRRGDIMETIWPIFQSFLVLAERKGIQLKMSELSKVEEFYFDKTKVEKVLANLLSNAVKFTSVGSVQLAVSKHGGETKNVQDLGSLTLTVTDTGTGIPPDALPHIFDRFYQVDSSSTRAGEGTGIGLALTKELVELMGGEISVNSKVGEGTTFVVNIPVRQLSDNASFPMPPKISPAESAPSQDWQTGGRKTDQLILLIEDNAELRQFIRSILANTYQVIEASNGAEGIRKAKDLLPDLIVSDLMMPEKNGYEVSDELKNNFLTSHIPIILLTAKSAIDSKIKGLQTGADAYLTKPFHTEELLVRIEKLIEGRKQLHEKFSQTANGPSIKKSVEQLPKIENEFLRKLTLMVEENLDNEHLSVEMLAEKVFMSRSQLFRKVKALTDQSVNEFIRNYRLDRAMELLKNKEGNVQEVASMVGFGDEKYFSTRFKERFGQSPSEV